MDKIQDNIFAIWKERGPTSNAVVQQVKHIIGARKVGHAGTLDPLAEGILVIGVDAGTKRLSEVVAKEKEYRATIQLGQESSTDDEEGEKTQGKEYPALSENTIQVVLKKFVGQIMQTPPIYSAVKICGKEAYKLARSGTPVMLKSRPAFVQHIQLVSFVWPQLVLDVTTGPGVYIRALARDIGRDLGTGAYLAALVRTRVGEYTKEKCKTIEELFYDFI